jgi:hypothetical protein
VAKLEHFIVTMVLYRYDGTLLQRRTLLKGQLLAKTTATV